MKAFLLLLFSITPTIYSFNQPHLDLSENKALTNLGSDFTSTFNENMYAALKLEQAGLARNVFEKALLGYQRLESEGSLKSKQLLTIIDFDKSANSERLWIIDLNAQNLLLKTLVAHGRNSGELYARKFSNQVNSYKSSLGFYITGKTYYGKHGLSLRLEGMEPGINDQAAARAIVMHGANYVSKVFIKRHGRLGRSHGCPAVPTRLAPDIIPLIANGSCLFIHHSDERYRKDSNLIQS